MGGIIHVASAQTAHTSFDGSYNLTIHGIYSYRVGDTAKATASVYDSYGNEIAYVDIPLDQAPYPIVFGSCGVDSQGLVVNTGDNLKLNIMISRNYKIG